MPDPTPLAILERVVRAMNAHDVDALVECFDERYRSEHTVHPRDNILGREAIRRKWARAFVELPDFRCEVIDMATQPGAVWVEWRWCGSQRDGSEMEWRGINIFGLHEDRIVWNRPYMELIERSGGPHAEDEGR